MECFSFGLPSAYLRSLTRIFKSRFVYFPSCLKNVCNDAHIPNKAKGVWLTGSQSLSLPKLMVAWEERHVNDAAWRRAGCGEHYQGLTQERKALCVDSLKKAAHRERSFQTNGEGEEEDIRGSLLHWALLELWCGGHVGQSSNPWPPQPSCS